MNALLLRSAAAVAAAASISYIFLFVFIKTKRTRFVVPFAAAAHQHKCRSELMNYAHIHTHTCVYTDHGHGHDNNDFVESTRLDDEEAEETESRETTAKNKIHTRLTHTHTVTSMRAPSCDYSTYRARALVSVFKCAVFNCVAASLIIYLIYNNNISTKSQSHPNGIGSRN